MRLLDGPGHRLWGHLALRHDRLPDQSHGLSNLTGEAGASVAIGQTIQVIGVLTALIAGVVATRANYRKPIEPGSQTEGPNDNERR